MNLTLWLWFTWTRPFGNIHTLAKVLFMNLTLWPCPNTWYVGLQEPDLLAISVHKPRCFYELDPLALSLHLACWFTWTRPLWQYPYTSQGAFHEPDPLAVSIHLACWFTWTRPYGISIHNPWCFSWTWPFGNFQRPAMVLCKKLLSLQWHVRVIECSRWCK